MSGIIRAPLGIFSQALAYIAGSLQAFVARPVWDGTDTDAPGQGVVNVARTTTTQKDAIFAQVKAGPGPTGYAVHAINYADGGSGIGGAAWGVGAGVVGNKRGNTAGNGVYGAGGIDGGAQSGVFGLKVGAGAGDAIAGKNEGTGAGVALFAWRQGAGDGAGSWVLRDSTGAGHGSRIERSGSGAGDGASIENSTTGAGSGLSVTRKLGAVNYSVGYLGFYDIETGESCGVYGTVTAGAVQWAGRFDGAVKVTGEIQVGGGMTPAAAGVGLLGTGGKPFQGGATVNAMTVTSDRRLKTDERSMAETGPAFIAKLRPVAYHKRGVDGVEFGFMADEVRDAAEAAGVPGWSGFSEAEEGGFQGLRYTQIIAPLVAEVQRLAAIVEQRGHA